MASIILRRTGRRFAELLDKIRRMEAPDAGWVRLCELLADALDDPAIIDSGSAAEYLELMLFVAADGVFVRVGGVTALPLVKV